MRVVISVLLLLSMSLSATAEQFPWTLTLEQRAVRRADPAANQARREAALAKGRTGFDPDDNVVLGSVDPASVAPIELIDSVVVFNLPAEIVAKRHRDWIDRGAADVLGPDFWNRLQVVFGEVIEQDREYRRPKAVAPVRLPNENSECVAAAKALAAARAQWGRETFDRFLYQVVAPGVFFYTSSSDPAGMTDPSRWVDEWKWREAGCR